MSLLIPLGLLGLLGLLILLLIYILKPNYQQKLISSTYVWKLSLKYKKKRLPISKLRNLLILLCQILIICCGALILAQPSLVNDTTVYAQEKIAIIDASASMNSSYDEVSRFERAVKKVQDLADEVFSSDGIMTVILAGREASYVYQRATAEDYNEFMESLNAVECSYGAGDIEGAISLAEETLQSNSDAEVVLYSASYKSGSKGIRVENVGDEREWNAAILNATAELVDNYFVFTVDVASYGKPEEIDIECTVTNANGMVNSIPLPVVTARCLDGETTRIVYAVDSNGYGEDVQFVPLADNTRIYSFERFYVSIPERELVSDGVRDSVAFDNEFFVYGGYKPVVKVQYFSSNPNIFVDGSLMTVAELLRSRWTIEIDVVTSGSPELEGYDVYVFEHKMPSRMPTDGIVFIFDPDTSVNSLNLGFSAQERKKIPNYMEDGATLAAGEDHPVLQYVNVSELRLTSYTPVVPNSMEPSYKILSYYEGNPVIFMKDEPDTKTVVFALDVHNSTLNLDPNFAILVYNFFDYLLPATFNDSVYDVYDTVKMDARAESLTVTSSNGVTGYDSFPADFDITMPGTYTVSQTLMSGTRLDEYFYARIPALQSNIKYTADVLSGISQETVTGITYEDLLLYFAAVIVALLFLEYILQSRGGI